jgi:hypothetical protein
MEFSSIPQFGKKPVARQAIQSSMDEMPARQHIPSSSLQAVADNKRRALATPNNAFRRFPMLN